MTNYVFEPTTGRINLRKLAAPSEYGEFTHEGGAQ